MMRRDVALPCVDEGRGGETVISSSEATSTQGIDLTLAGLIFAHLPNLFSLCIFADIFCQWFFTLVCFYHVALYYIILRIWIFSKLLYHHVFFFKKTGLTTKVPFFFSFHCLITYEIVYYTFPCKINKLFDVFNGWWEIDLVFFLPNDVYTNYLSFNCFITLWLIINNWQNQFTSINRTSN